MNQIPDIASSPPGPARPHVLDCDQGTFGLLSGMMDASDSRSGESMSDRELVDEVATMIIAGHETSASTLNWAWLMLAKDEDSAARVRAEAGRATRGGVLDDERLHDLVFTRQVLEETLRLYPPVWLFTRRALEDDEIGGQRIQAGDNVFLSPWVTQRLARYWPDPEAFRPGRFAPDASDERVDHAFFPFSAGPRRCIGEFFSFVEMRTHLAMLASRFRLRPVANRPVALEPAINLRTRHNLIMTIERVAP